VSEHHKLRIVLRVFATLSVMKQFDSRVTQWLSDFIDADFKATKHAFSNQDEVYKIETEKDIHYLKVSSTLKAEYNNLLKLKDVLPVPRVISYTTFGDKDHLLISALSGKNVAELFESGNIKGAVKLFATAVKRFHSTDASAVFSDAKQTDVLLHGDMSTPNVIVSAHEDIGYIDVGRVSFGHPEKDLADAIWSLQRNIGPDYGELFLKLYGEYDRTQVVEKALAFRYNPHD